MITSFESTEMNKRIDNWSMCYGGWSRFTPAVSETKLFTEDKYRNEFNCENKVLSKQWVEFLTKINF